MIYSIRLSAPFYRTQCRSGFEGTLQINDDEKIFGISYLPGQYDQHGDSTIQCIQIVSGERALVKVAKIVVLTGELTQKDFDSIKHYMINPVDSQEASLEPLVTLVDEIREPKDIKPLEGFISLKADQLETFRVDNGFAMTTEDILFVQNYFNNDEKRNPTITELKVIDTIGRIIVVIRPF